MSCPVRYASLHIYILHFFFSQEVIEMVNISKLDMALSSSSGSGEGLELEEKSKGTQDHMNAFQYITEKGDSFVLDIDQASSSGISKDNTHANSKITRSLSRKGSQRWVDMKVNGNGTLHDHKDTIPFICSPKGSCMPEKPAMVMPIGSMDHSMNPHIHHQITIINGTTNESKCITRRNSFNRSSSRALDPKRVLLFFSTMSSIGTMLLIYFTLTKQNTDEYGGDWK